MLRSARRAQTCFYRPASISTQPAKLPLRAEIAQLPSVVMMDPAGGRAAAEWELMPPVSESSVRALGLSRWRVTEAVEHELYLARGDPVPVAAWLCDERRLGPGQGPGEQ